MKKFWILVVLLLVVFGFEKVSMADEFEMSINNDIVGFEYKNTSYTGSSTRTGQKAGGAGTAATHLLLEGTFQDKYSSWSVCTGITVGNSTFQPSEFTLTAGLLACGMKEKGGDVVFGIPLRLELEAPLSLAFKNRFLKYLVFEVGFDYAPQQLTFSDGAKGMQQSRVALSLNPWDNVKFTLSHRRAKVYTDNGNNNNVISGVLIGATVLF